MYNRLHIITALADGKHRAAIIIACYMACRRTIKNTIWQISDILHWGVDILDISASSSSRFKQAVGTATCAADIGRTCVGGKDGLLSKYRQRQAAPAVGDRFVDWSIGPYWELSGAPACCMASGLLGRPTVHWCSLINPDATEAINQLTLFTGFHHNAACSVAIYGKAIIRMELSPTKYHP